MELRSKKTSHCLSLLFAMLPITTLGAADLNYEVRHHRALKDHVGVLTISDQGVGYQQLKLTKKQSTDPKKPPKLDTVHFQYQDIQELWVSPNKMVLVTYKDRKWLFGIDKEFEFFLPEGKTVEAAFTMLKDKLDRRFVAAMADAQVQADWELPVKRLGMIQGSEGNLMVGSDRIVYKTTSPRQSRTWRFQDIENVSTSDRYQLTLTTFERAKNHYGSMKGFNFQLKQPLDEKLFEELWKKLNRGKGLQFLTSIEERNHISK